MYDQAEIAKELEKVFEEMDKFFESEGGKKSVTSNDMDDYLSDEVPATETEESHEDRLSKPL